MKLYSIFTALMIGCFTISCGNSSKNQQTEATAQQVNPLEKVFKEAYEKKETLYDLIRKDIIKERIIREYSTNFYNKALEYTVFAYEVVYKDGKYTAYGSLTRLAGTSVDLIYDPISDLLTVKIMEEDRVVQSDGEVHYNTKGWEVRYPKDEFGEDVKSQAEVYYHEDGFTIQIVKLENGVLGGFFTIYKLTNDNVYLCIVDKILIKDNQTGEIYNINFEKSFDDTDNEKAPWEFNGAHILIGGTNLDNFMNIVTKLQDYSISFQKGNSNTFVRNPENLCNIRDAVDYFLN